MRKIFCFLAVCTIAASGCNSTESDPPTITGELKNAANLKIYFERITAEGDVPVDSTVADSKGNFTLQNKAGGMDYYLLRTGDQHIAYLLLNGGETLHITGDAQNLEKTYDVEGSPDTKLLLGLKRYDERISDSINLIYENFRGENPYQKDSLGAILQQNYDSMLRNYSLNLVRNNLSSLVSLSGSQHLDKQKDLLLLTELQDSLSKAFPDNPYVKVFSNQVDDLKKLPVGSLAPEIKLSSPEGKEISLSSLKGKVVVIDFWASWCGPCRREMPEMVQLYRSFKDQGLEIYGVSLDDDEDAWKRAIEHDRIQWLQVSELKKWESAVVELYGVDEIPHTVLLDREGKIVAKGLDPHELRVEIQALLSRS